MRCLAQGTVGLAISLSLDQDFVATICGFVPVKDQLICHSASFIVKCRLPVAIKSFSSLRGTVYFRKMFAMLIFAVPIIVYQ